MNIIFSQAKRQTQEKFLSNKTKFFIQFQQNNL